MSGDLLVVSMSYGCENKPEARGVVEEGSYRVVNGATPDSSVDRSEADRKSGRTPNEG